VKKTAKPSPEIPTNETLPSDQREAILRAILHLLPNPKSSPLVAESSIALKRLSDDMQAGQAVTHDQVGAALAATYQAYSLKLKETAEHSQVDHSALEAASRGYALLADGSRRGDFLELAEGLKTVQDAVAALAPGGAAAKSAPARKKQAHKKIVR
jgi:hypothetical protein